MGYIAPLETSLSRVTATSASSSKSPAKTTPVRRARNTSQSASKEGYQSAQDYLSTTTASSSRRSRKERSDQKSLVSAQDESLAMKEQLTRLEKNVAKMFAFKHQEDTFSTRAHSARGPNEQRSLERTEMDDKSEKYGILRQTLNRLSERCMNKFDEANAKLAEQEKEIARRRLAVTGAGKTAVKARPSVAEAKPLEK